MINYRHLTSRTLLALAAIGMAGPAAAALIDFEGSGFTNNQTITSAGFATTITATGGIGQARIYDTKAGNSTDPDLNHGANGFTNSATGGATGVSFGKVLIIQEANNKGNNQGKLPDDNSKGGTLLFDFSQPLTLTSVDILDADKNKVKVELFSGSALLGTYNTLFNSDTGDKAWPNKFETISFGTGGISGISGVTRMKITSSTSFAVDNISAVPLPAAFWLFGSALLGLVGVGRARTRA